MINIGNLFKVAKTVPACLCAALTCLWEMVTLTYLTESQTVPASGWYAVYREDDEFWYFPLVAWEVVYQDGKPLETVGLVFEDNKPPFVVYADESPHFLGYQMTSNSLMKQHELEVQP